MAMRFIFRLNKLFKQNSQTLMKMNVYMILHRNISGEIKGLLL